jgi:serine/threonine protein kinase
VGEGSEESDATLPSGPGAEAPVADPAYGTELQGRFRHRLMKPLGRGAFGSVFLARCLDHDPHDVSGPPEALAVKILGDAKVEAKDLVRRELSALLALSSDRIPRVYDWRVDGEPAFVALQYYPDGSLRDYMKLAGPADEDAVWRLLGDLLSALDAAHRAGLLHLDVKPANVLLDGRGGFVLTDFGVSQASRIGRDAHAFSVGTRGYQAPEQREARVEEYDLRTDLWGVGATAWAFAAGVNLADRTGLLRSDPREAVYSLPGLSERRLGCSPQLEELIMSLLHLDPGRRPGSAAEVLARVGKVISRGSFDSATFAASRRVKASEAETREVIGSLVDPLLIDLCDRPSLCGHFVKFDPAELMCGEGEHSYYAFLLLRGTVVVSQGGRELTRVSREGSFLGEISAFTGTPRTASMHAAREVFALVLNTAELERLVTANPAIGLRVIRSLAHRLAKLPADGLEKRRG